MQEKAGWEEAESGGGQVDGRDRLYVYAAQLCRPYVPHV